jgi:hypothetical protein
MYPVLQLFNGCGWFGKSTEIINKEKLVCVQNLFNNSQTYCTAAFLDITQALDKVWHQGLLSKLRARVWRRTNSRLR